MHTFIIVTIPFTIKIWLNAERSVNPTECLCGIIHVKYVFIRDYKGLKNEKKKIDNENYYNIIFLQHMIRWLMSHDRAINSVIKHAVPKY